MIELDSMTGNLRCTGCQAIGDLVELAAELGTDRSGAAAAFRRRHFTCGHQLSLLNLRGGTHASRTAEEDD